MSMVNENEQKRPFDGEGQISWRVIVGIVVAALAVVFILQNTEKVDIDFLVFSFEVGMWFGLLLAFVFGVIVGWGLHMGWRRRQRNRAAEKARGRRK